MLVYDGDCGLCTRYAQWAIERLPRRARVVAWQTVHDLGGLGLVQRDVATAVYWIEPGQQPQRGHRAIGRTLLTIGGIWKPVGWLIRLPPVSWLAAGVYWLVARNRHRLPGRTEACRLDASGQRR